MTGDREQEQIGKLEGVLEGIGESIHKLDKDLHGNGQPGIIDRLARVEENICAMGENLEKQVKVSTEEMREVKESLKTMNEAITLLAQSFKVHLDDKECHSFKTMILKKNNILYLVIGFLVLHSLFPEPFNLNGLGELAKKLLGLP